MELKSCVQWVPHSMQSQIAEGFHTHNTVQYADIVQYNSMLLASVFQDYLIAKTPWLLCPQRH